jgi:glutathione S-transferase
MKTAGIAFRETHVGLRRDDTKTQILKHSPSGQIPALKWGDVVVSDSLAICETMADLFPEKGLWPADARARAMARSVSAEMHAGFVDVRRDMPMDIVNRYPGEGHSEAALAAARRIVDIWSGMRARFGAAAAKDDGFLFGGFSIADAMYAPVVTRFRTYGVDVAKLGDDGRAADYMKAVLRLPAFLEWEAGAKAEMAERG